MFENSSMKVCATFPRGRSYCWFCRTFVVPHTLGNGFTAVTAVVWSVRVYGRATILLCGTAKKCWLSNFRSVGTLFHRYRWSSFLYFVRPYDQAKTKPLPQHQPPRWANVVVNWCDEGHCCDELRTQTRFDVIQHFFSTE